MSCVPFNVERPDPSLTRLFVRFALSGLVAVIVIGAVAFVVIRHAASAGAIRQAQGLTRLAGRGIAEPAITPGVLAGRPADLAALDRVVRNRILSGTPIVRVKVWDASGRIVYSDARQLIGSVFPLDADEQQTLATGGVDADASDLNRPENRTERSFKRLVEVYVGIRGPGGRHLLYEDYERSSTISASSRRQWMVLVPALVGALLVLYLVQVPLAYSLARQRARPPARARAAVAARDRGLRHRAAEDRPQTCTTGTVQRPRGRVAIAVGSRQRARAGRAYGRARRVRDGPRSRDPPDDARAAHAAGRHLPADAPSGRDWRRRSTDLVAPLRAAGMRRA